MRRIVILLLCAVLVVPLCGNATATEPKISAKSYVLLDGDTGAFLAGKNEHTPMPCASTTKVMTAVVVLEHLAPDLSVTVTDFHTRTEGSRVYYRAGEVQTVQELLYGLLLSSGNDAALALAEAACGSVAEFVAEMNRTAARLGMENTCFQNPSGLPQEGHYASAYDLAILMRYAMTHPLFAQITGTRERAVTGRTLINHNKLLKTLAGVDGGKTGFTKAAGRCLISTAVRNGRRLIAVTLSAPNDWQDHADLYTYGFSLYRPYVMTDGERFGPVLPVVGGQQATAQLRCEPVTVWLREDEDVEQVNYLPHFVYAPIEPGAVGEAVWMLGEKVLARGKVTLPHAVEEAAP